MIAYNHLKRGRQVEGILYSRENKRKGLSEINLLYFVQGRYLIVPINYNGKSIRPFETKKPRYASFAETRALEKMLDSEQGIYIVKNGTQTPISVYRSLKLVEIPSSLERIIKEFKGAGEKENFSKIIK